jgi:hypothetical protein
MNTPIADVYLFAYTLSCRSRDKNGLAVKQGRAWDFSVGT